MSEIKPLLGHLSLGKAVEYISNYTPSLLCSLARSDSRAMLGIENNALPFVGVDIWTAYELSWLDLRGKPVVACATFSFPCQSVGMIESKSLKLYLNSFNQTRFSSLEDVKKTLILDLSFAAQGSVQVDLFSAASFAHPERFMGHLPGECIDDAPVAINQYQVDPELLSLDSAQASGQKIYIQESLYSHLLKTNCPVTGQPDWASISVRYSGPRINRESLLKYICSYRQQADFHEQCVEQIFRDLLEYCHCEKLTVEARYQRRGGLDINPFRTNCAEQPLAVRLLRQ
jgi:7-cyano-7-deazaguanine reductase